MSNTPRLRLGQCSEAGRKASNQDALGACLDPGELAATKGLVVALADGISSSPVSGIASQAAIRGFLADYYATPESWTVQTSAQRVLQALNAWLHAQSHAGQGRHDLERGYLCTFSAVVVKADTAHLFHVGDARIVRRQGARLLPLTREHRLRTAPGQGLLSRALGMREGLELDYQRLRLEVGDTLMLMTDGVHEFLSEAALIAALDTAGDDLDAAARRIVAAALAAGSPDNLSVQILQVAWLPPPGLDALGEQAAALPLPPLLAPRQIFDGYRILRDLHHGPRSHVYLALDPLNGRRLVLKAPARDLGQDPSANERLLREEWIARRLNSPYLLRAWPQPRPRRYLYTLTEYIEGRNLSQWLHDQPAPDLETVRDLVEQIARGLRALHRQAMLHQDLRPQNILVDRQGGVHLIDFGAVQVAGLAETAAPDQRMPRLGTAQYSAPEILLGEPGSPRSDLYSLAVITYQLLGGDLPYGSAMARAGNRAAQRRLAYRPLYDERRAIPSWIDAALRRALHPDPARRQDSLSEFVADLRRPAADWRRAARAPLIERHPLRFWQGLSALLALLLVLLLIEQARPPVLPPVPPAPPGALP